MDYCIYGCYSVHILDIKNGRIMDLHTLQQEIIPEKDRAFERKTLVATAKGGRYS